jgi:hypothetical protein
MRKFVDIANSEGHHLAIAEKGERLYLVVKMKRNNDCAYFPITKEQIEQFLDGKITVREMLPSYDSFIHIDKYYEEIRNSAWIEPKDKILDTLEKHKK